MEGASTPMIGLADKELRAYLGEIHDAAARACVSLGAIMRLVHGQGARANPHHSAALAILRQLEVNEGAAPADQLAALCALPDADLRQKAAGAWAKLYGAPMPAATRL